MGDTPWHGPWPPSGKGRPPSGLVRPGPATDRRRIPTPSPRGADASDAWSNRVGRQGGSRNDGTVISAANRVITVDVTRRPVFGHRAAAPRPTRPHEAGCRGVAGRRPCGLALAARAGIVEAFDPRQPPPLPAPASTLRPAAPRASMARHSKGRPPSFRSAGGTHAHGERQGTEGLKGRGPAPPTANTSICFRNTTRKLVRNDPPPGRPEPAKPAALLSLAAARPYTALGPSSRAAATGTGPFRQPYAPVMSQCWGGGSVEGGDVHTPRRINEPIPVMPRPTAL